MIARLGHAAEGQQRFHPPRMRFAQKRAVVDGSTKGLRRSLGLAPGQQRLPRRDVRRGIFASSATAPRLGELAGVTRRAGYETSDQVMALLRASIGQQILRAAGVQPA